MVEPEARGDLPPKLIVNLPGSGDAVPEYGEAVLSASEDVTARDALVDFSIQPAVSHPESELQLRRTLTLAYHVPATHLMRIPAGWVESVMCTAIAPDGRYVVDSLRGTRQAEENGYVHLEGFTYERPMDRSVAEVHGPALLVGLPTGGNYFHWLFEALPRWLMARDHLTAATKVLVPQLGRMERSALEAGGVPPEVIIELPSRSMVKVDELLVAPRGIRSSVQVLPPAVRALRGTVGDIASAPRRLMISRAGARRRLIANEAEVAATASRHGFEVVDTGRMTVAEQMRLFAGAEAVLALHGAGIANIVFAPPGCTVVELQPPDLDRARAVLYWNVAAAADHRYVQVVCAACADQPDVPAAERHIEVDVRHLDVVLGRVLEPPIP